MWNCVLGRRKWQDLSSIFFLYFWIIIHLCNGCCWNHDTSPLLTRISITKMLIIHRCTFILWTIALSQLETTSCRKQLSYMLSRATHNQWLIHWCGGTKGYPTCLKMGPTLRYHLCCRVPLWEQTAAHSYQVLLLAQAVSPAAFCFPSHPSPESIA